MSKKKEKQKVLIIKLGLSETLVGEVSNTTSLGDVLRSTVILPLYKRAKVTWLVTPEVAPLLKGNPFIRRILPYNLTTVLQLQAERFDTIINLEKVAGICALSDSLSAWRRYGFRFDSESGEAKAYDGSQHVIELCSDVKWKRSNKKLSEEFLFEMVEAKWNGEMPILGYKPTSEVKFDVGFNSKVGEKWPIKAWPPFHWDKLGKILEEEGYSVELQRGLDSLEDYIEWINSCRLLVTNDSLGLHIAHALGKKIVALFGPTVSGEVYVKSGVKLLPEPEPECLPCMSNVCSKERTCMYDISSERVFEGVKKLLPKK